jgi:hypothetical protein
MLIRDHNRVIDPFHTPRRLLIEMYTETSPETGVFSGTDHGFEPGLRNKRQPVVLTEFDYETFEISGLPPSPKDQIRSYHFALTSKVEGGHMTYLSTRELSVTISDIESWVNYQGLRILLEGSNTPRFWGLSR